MLQPTKAVSSLKDLEKLGRKNDFRLRFTPYSLYLGLFVGLISDVCP